MAQCSNERAPFVLGLESRDSPGRTDPRLLAAEGRYFPHRLHFSIHGEQPVDQRARRAGRDDPHRREQFRSVRGVDPRHLSGAREWAADATGASVAGRLSSLHHHGRDRRADQRPPRNPRPDQLVHRHARFRHAAPRPQSMVHRRPSGRWRASQGLRGDRGQNSLHRGSPGGRLRARGRDPALGSVRLFAAGSISLHNRRQPARG